MIRRCEMLLQLYDMDHTRIGGLKNAKDIKIESELDTGDKEITFSWHKNNKVQPEHEQYIRTDSDEYVVKEINLSSKGFYSITAKLNLEAIEGRSWKVFVAENQTALEMANYALAGTGWTCKSAVSETKRRNISLTKVNSFKVFEGIIGAFTCEIKWDTLSKTVFLMDKVGEDKGAYFIQGLNLKELKDNSDTYDFATRIYPYGADELDITEVNNGVEYLENFQYSTKIIEIIWEDSNYTDAEALKEDARYKLNEISKPKKTYSAKVIDLAKMKPEYSILQYSCGDTITLIDNSTGVREKQRITKTTEYPNTPEKNTCEISNTILTFEKMQKQLLEAAKALENITTNNGTVKGSSVDKIDISQIINIDEELASILEEAKIGTLYVTEQIGAPYAVLAEILSTIINTTDIKISNRADIETEYVMESYILNGYAEYMKIGTLESDQITAIDMSLDTLKSNVGNIQALMFGSAVGGTITTEFANTVIEQVGQSQIKSAMIESLTVDKILAGNISTNKFRIVSDSGHMLLSDNTMQIYDGVRTRVQIGRDASDDYNMYVWDQEGNLMFDALGMTESGIQRPIIRNDMVSDTANIDAKKLDIHSLFTEINGSTEVIKGSKVMLDSEAQTLDLAFTTIKTTVEGTKESLDKLDLSARNLAVLKSKSLRLSTYVVNDSSNIVYDKKDSALASGIYTSFDRGAINGISGFYTTWNLFLPAMSRMIVGENYTLSVMAKSSSGKGTLEWRADGSPTIEQSDTTLTSEWKKYYIVFTLNTDNRLTICFYVNSTSDDKSTISIGDFKIEKGNKASDWSPAPEDITDITTTVTMQGTVISTIQGQISSKVWQTDINSATGAIESKYSTLQQNLDSFKTTVGNTYVTKEIAVASIVPYYYKSTSATTQAGGSWSITVPTWESGKYIWEKDLVTYANGSTEYTTPVNITGAAGQNGNTGRGISSAVVQYYKSTSSTTQTGGSWGTAVPEITATNQYIWTRTHIVYTDNTTSDTTPQLDRNVTTSYTNYTQLRDKFSWIVSSGTSASNMVLTNEFLQVTAKNIVLTGNTTFNSYANIASTALENANEAQSSADNIRNNIYKSGTTTIDGGKIDTVGLFAKDITVTNRLLLNGGYLTTSASRTTYNQTVAGMTMNKDGIGGYSSPSQYWNMSAAGKLVAAGGEFTGKITAVEGKIAGFQINNYGIYSGTDSLYSSTYGIYVGTDGILNKGSYGTVRISEGTLVVSDNTYETYIQGGGIHTNELYIGRIYIDRDGIEIYSPNKEIGFLIGADNSGLRLSDTNVSGDLSVTPNVGINFNGAGAARIMGYAWDGASVDDDYGANLIIESWYGVGFRDMCTGQGTTVAIDCRSGNMKTRGRISVNGRINSIGTYNATTTTSPNVYISTSYNLCRCTSSSRRYKYDIKPIDMSVIKPLYSVPICTYKYKPGYLSYDDARYGKDIPGFIAEDVAYALPIAANYDTSGQVEMWDNNIIVPCMMGLIQDLNNRLETLENLQSRL